MEGDDYTIDLSNMDGTTSTITITGSGDTTTVSYTHLRAHETSLHLVCRLLLEKMIWKR